MVLNVTEHFYIEHRLERIKMICFEVPFQLPLELVRIVDLKDKYLLSCGNKILSEITNKDDTNI
jgi:hypothetical protein